MASKDELLTHFHISKELLKGFRSVFLEGAFAPPGGVLKFPGVVFDLFSRMGFGGVFMAIERF